MSNFVPKNDLEIAALGEEAVLAYIAAAREAGDLGSAQTATGMLAYRHQDKLRARVQLKASGEHVDQIVDAILMSAIRSSFDGRFAGEFTNWLKTITKYRIADFYRGGGDDPTFLPLPDEHEGEEGIWVQEGMRDIEIELLADRELADAICSQRGDEIHRAAIQLYGFEVLGFQELDATATAAEIKRLFGKEISEPNVHQVWRRFLVDYRKAWLEAEAAGGDTT